MKLLANKDKVLRKNLLSSEIKERQFKFLRVAVLNSPDFKTERECYKFFFNGKIQNRVSKTKLVRRCLLTYKARVMHKKFKISRVKLKKMLDLNIVAGYKKAVW